MYSNKQRIVYPELTDSEYERRVIEDHRLNQARSKDWRGIRVKISEHIQEHPELRKNLAVGRIKDYQEMIEVLRKAFKVCTETVHKQTLQKQIDLLASAIITEGKILLGNKTSSSKITQEMIFRARDYPITSLLIGKGPRKCLWHDERTPSMHVLNRTNRVKCYGCGKMADVIELYQKLHNCSFQEAVIHLQ